MLFEQIGRPLGSFDAENTKERQETVIDNVKKRRKSDATHGVNSDWDFLLSYRYHNSIQKDTRDIENRPPLIYKSESVLFSHIPMIFFTLHLLYEDLKLDMSLKDEVEWLGQLLYQIAFDLDLKEFVFHYFQDFPQLVLIDQAATIKEIDLKKLLHTNFYFGMEVPNLFKFVYTVIRELPTNPYPFIKDINVNSKHIAQVYFFTQAMLIKIVI